MSAKEMCQLSQFLADRPALLARIQAQWKTPLRDAAAMNATRFALVERLRTSGLPVEGSSGGRTSWNRELFGIPKSHALDASGFPRGSLPRSKQVQRMQTGDLVEAVVPPPRKTAGRHVGRVAVRTSGSFRLGKWMASIGAIVGSCSAWTATTINFRRRRRRFLPICEAEGPPRRTLGEE